MAGDAAREENRLHRVLHGLHMHLDPGVCLASFYVGYQGIEVSTQQKPGRQLSQTFSVFLYFF